jgi:uroporphyrinogen-III decarboxylase
VNSRERFLAVMCFEPVDRLPLWEFGYWISAVRRWYCEGLPCHGGIPAHYEDGDIARGEALWWDQEKPAEQDIHDYFQHDPGLRHVFFNNYLAPEFTAETLEDYPDKVVVRDKWGTVQAERKDRLTLPEIIRGPVQSRDDWEQLKAERLRPTLAGRLPPNWEQLKAEYRVRDYPLAIGGAQGFFGTARRLLGVVPLLTGFIDEPELIHDIMDCLGDFYAAIYDALLQQIDADYALIWEDMCYKTGPLISPSHFREFMLRPYQKLTGVFRDHGIKAIHTDTDGNCWKLIPLFLEAGCTGLYPFEVAAGMDVVEVREAFPKLQMLGGLDKRALADGPAAIDAELEAKVLPIMNKGGFIPHVDHAVPHDVCWSNLVHYRTRMRELIEEAAK